MHLIAPNLYMESGKSSSKITDIVRLQQILKKWKKAACAPKGSKTTTSTSSNNTTTAASKSIKFIKRTLSFSDMSGAAAASSSSNDPNANVPKGYLAVCVGKELKRYVIPTEYLGHQAFGILLREAEEEFGFQQEGVLKIPCQVSVFEKILKLVQENRDDHVFFLHELGGYSIDNADTVDCWSPSHHPQLCR